MCRSSLRSKNDFFPGRSLAHSRSKTGPAKGIISGRRHAPRFGPRRRCSHTSQNEEVVSQQSTSADELENEEPDTKRFRPYATVDHASSSAAASKVNMAELALNVKALYHQMDLVMKKLNVRPCECKDCCVTQKRMTSGALKRPRQVHATPVSKSIVRQNGDSLGVLNTSNVSLNQTPNVGITPPINGVNIAQALVEQTHCPTIRGRGRGRPMLIGDELHNALVDYLVNLEIVNNTRLYPMDAFKYAQEFIKQHSPGLLSDEGGSVVLKQSWAVKLVTHVRSRKQKLIELVSQSTNEQPEDLLSKLNKDAGIPAKLAKENSLNGFLPASQQHVVPEQHYGIKPEAVDSDIVVEKLGFESDHAKLAIDADQANLATFASLIAQLQQQQTAQ
ncbi:hypothetical protein L596_027545 [Steinernema carpocapsae]|uniref:Uncharacterized protein n=1 Tax=Steinernema carpocapsae TaxID=34508 RepID=A0A4U5LVT5_STECR|nr:hypothetical protein L596_027545 [Steinernema carpocapsae]